MNGDNILEVENLSVAYENGKILDGLNFNVKKGDVMAIVGPNGAGKTVLFRALLGLIPHSGYIHWKPGIKIGYVPQKLAVERDFPLTVLEFLKMKKNAGGADYGEREIFHALNSVGIKTGESEEHHLIHHILNRPLSKLSGGEFQRILIAWSMIGDPDVLLFDEPTAGIDVSGEETVYNLLKKLQASATLTILLISHDLNIVYKYTDVVMCLNKKQLCLGKPRDILDPQGLAGLYGGEARFYHHDHENN